MNVLKFAPSISRIRAALLLLGAATAVGCATRTYTVSVGDCPNATSPSHVYVVHETIPLNPPVASSGCGPSCATTAESKVAMAVTRPSACNDYPVSYRVTVPDTESRVRNVERIVIR